MDTEFWLERWAKHEIGFHQPAVNEYLVRYWPALNLPDDAPVFVPLCGKTLDMRWLAERGHSVLGIEISRSACREFFEEWGIEPQVSTSGAFEYWQAGKITILCGDFFDLRQADVANVAGVFDRAALIALPVPMRTAYANKLREILPRGAQMLLVAPDYDQEQMSGPPFAVGVQEVRKLFSVCTIEELASVEVTNAPANARFRQRGLTQLIERVFRIEVSD